jgi:beta-lactamase regulating signal transducer with metallopeptidase domain
MKVARRATGQEGLEAMGRRLMRRLHIGRAVRFLESTTVDVPTVIGWLRPVVLLPVSTLAGLTPQQVEAILAHELAHIRRHDYLVNLLQVVVETLLFYHPLCGGSRIASGSSAKTAATISR